MKHAMQIKNKFKLVNISNSGSVWKKCKEVIFLTASYLTDPICKSREYYYMTFIVDELYPFKGPNTFQRFKNFLLKQGFLLGHLFFGALATVTTLPAIILRSLASKLSSEPYLYKKGLAKEKTLSSGESFTLLSWNICFVPAGYSITDGGVLSSYYREKRVSAEILNQNADVVCLYEAFDTGSAAKLAETLKPNYAHIYYNINPRGIGTSSGIFIASKFPVTDLDIELFPESTLVGSTKYSAKSVVGFTIGEARIYATHTQNGNEPEYATHEELKGNQKQMEIVLEKIRQAKDQNLALILCGDLNITRDNLEAIPNLHLVESTRSKHDNLDLTFIDGNKKEKAPTWGGDASCAPRFYGKQASHALELDYVLAVSGTVKNIITTVDETFYDPNVVTWQALSDHKPLKTTIFLQ